MWRQCTLLVMLVLGWMAGGGFSLPASAQEYGVCEPYRLQGAFCAQVNMYQTLISEAYAHQPAPSSPQYNAWMQHVGCLQSMQQIAAQYCSQFGGDGTFPTCNAEYSSGWNCQALSHYMNFLNELNALPPTNVPVLIQERDRMRNCLTFIINNLQANCSGGQFNVPSFNPGNTGGWNPGAGSDPGSGGAVGGGYGNPGYPGYPGGGPGYPGGGPVNVPYSGGAGKPVPAGMDECEFMTDIIDVADHCVRARLILEKIERLQSQKQLSENCRHRLQQMYMDEARQCEQDGGNPSGQPTPIPLKPSDRTPAGGNTGPCDALAIPDVADPCVALQHVMDTLKRAQQMGASPECMRQLKQLFYEKQEACRHFSTGGNSGLNTGPCDALAIPDVADPCVALQYVMDMLKRAQQMRASTECLSQLKQLFYEKQEACRQFSKGRNTFPYQTEDPR